MLKHRHSPTPLLILTFAAALACDRVPLSLGTGIDDLVNDDDDSSGGGYAGTGAGGGSSTGTGGYAGGTATGAGGAASGDCNDTYTLCLESGELPEICRDDLERCLYTGYPSTAGTGAGGGSSTGTGAAGAAGAGGTPTDTGAAGTGAGGATGDDCNDTYSLCLESGEPAELCRDALERCQYAGYPSTAGTGSGGGASAGAGGTGSD